VRLPIRTRLTAWYMALLAVIVTALCGFLVLRLRADLVADSDRRLSTAAEHIALGYKAEGAKDFRDVAATVLPRSDAAAQVVDARGVVVASHGAEVAERPMADRRTLAAALAGESRHRTVSLGAPSAKYRELVRPAERRGRRFALVTIESLAPADRSVHRVFILLLIGAPAALLLTAAGGWWLARKALRPVERMTEQADRLGAESLEGRLEVPRTQDEVARLGRTLNAMLDRIESGVQDKRRLIADASHELRSPLAVMRSELDVTLAEPGLDEAARVVLESAREEVVRMSRLVDDLLTLSTIDEGRLALVEEPVDLLEIATTAAARTQIVVDGEPAPALGDALRLGQAVRNLIDNAVQFGPPGGAVEVTAWHRGGEAGVTVTDRGPGIPEGDSERIFERFVRLDNARGRGSGGGLGLAICREVALAHGGRAWVEPDANGGSRFSLALPARAVLRGAQEPVGALPPTLNDMRGHLENIDGETGPAPPSIR
jgi:signal transduction histidine kinase